MDKIKLLFGAHKIAIIAGVVGFAVGFLVKGFMKPKGGNKVAYRRK